MLYRLRNLAKANPDIACATLGFWILAWSLFWDCILTWQPHKLVASRQSGLWYSLAIAVLRIEPMRLAATYGAMLVAFGLLGFALYIHLHSKQFAERRAGEE
ncbi:MAG: hypothetical protein ACT4QC_21310 [Planctomycetaceae bacterium]